MSEEKVLDVSACFSDAIKNEEFEVFYQPKVSLKNYRLCGAEALCRWRHNGEMIPPFKFIPQLEAGQDICVLDFYMLDHVCADIERWLKAGMGAVRVSVNLSRRHLVNDHLIKELFEIIDRYDFPNKLIEFELTETSTDVDYQELKKLVTALSQRGIYISIDDFGMGYSSLNLLRDMPWNTLKIDRSLLPVGFDFDPNLSVILEHVIAMAHTLNIECIAEGVETVEQIQLLKEKKCFMAQGFYFDKPLEKPEFEKRLTALKTFWR